jgi:imidazolonepropionase-like amidohydrolase
MVVRPNNDGAMPAVKQCLRSSVIGLTAALFVACGDAPSPQALPTTLTAELVIHCGTLIDGISDKPLIDQVILVDQARIRSVVSADQLGVSATEERAHIDLREFTCLPGLINTHVHFDGNPEDSVDYSIYARRTAAENLALVLANAKTTLLTGFTTVRHVGAWFPNAVYQARDKIRAGEAIGPRILTAGPYLTIPGGGGDLTFPEIPVDQIPPESQLGIASTSQQFAQRAEAAIAGGADFLKVIASGAVFSLGTDPGAPEMSQADIAAVVKVAKQYDKQVTAHVHSDQSGRDAILAGVALSMDIYNGTYTDTIGRSQGYPEIFLQRNTQTTEAQRAVFKKAYAAGVTLLYGTDAAVLPHTMGGWQFATMIEHGMTPMEAIRSATSVAADHLRIDTDVGAVIPGRQADIIAVKVDPLTDPLSLRDVDVVIQAGIVVKQPPL